MGFYIFLEKAMEILARGRQYSRQEKGNPTPKKA
jgi:hypothetical protein